MLTHYPYWYSNTSKCVVDIVTSFRCPLLKEEKTTAQSIHKTEYVYRYYFGEVHTDKKYSERFKNKFSISQIRPGQTLSLSTTA